MNAKLAKAAAGLAVLAAIAAVFAMLPTSGAQTTSPGFGTKVQFGENDFIPTLVLTGGGGGEPEVARIDFGTPTDVNDDCYYLDLDGDSPAAGAIDEHDLRLVVSSGCSGKTTGSLVTSGDAAETGPTTTLIGTTFVAGVRYGDANSNSRYDQGDCVFYTTSATGLTDGSDGTAPSIRLTGCEGKLAGTLVKAGDADYDRFRTSTTDFAGDEVRVFNKDLSTAAAPITVFTPGDRLYYLQTAAIAPNLVPLYAVRLFGDAGQFGTQVKLGESDFIPTIDAEEDLGGSLFAGVEVSRVDFGSDGDVNNDCFYADINGDGDVDENDLRLVASASCGGVAGTLVRSGDPSFSSEDTGTTTLIDPPGAGVELMDGIRVGDEDQSGRYSMNDCVFFTTDAGGLDASTGDASISIRLTPCKGKPAGTLVFSGDTDFQAYQTATITEQFTVPEVALFNKDQTLTGAADSLTPGDLLYLTRGTAVGTAVAGGLIPLYSVRLLGSTETGAFGTQVKFGDRDFVPTLIAGLDLTETMHLDADGSSQVTTDCYFLNSNSAGGGAASVELNDIRMNDCSITGKKAGSLVTTGDASERVTADDTPDVRVAYADVGGSGRYDAPDYVYLTTGTGTACQSSQGGSVTIRLTGAGTFKAGTLVFSGDTDFSSYGAAGCAVLQAVGDNSIGIFDADLSATFTNGDRMYVSAGAADVAVGDLVALYSVRLVGDFGATTGPTASPSPSPSPSPTNDTASPSPTTSPSPSPSPSPTTSPTSSPTTPKPTKTPGFEMVLAVAALGAAFLALRRRN